MLFKPLSVSIFLLYMITAHSQELPNKSTITPIDLIELLGEFNDEDVEDLEASMRDIESKHNTANQKKTNLSTLQNSKKGAQQ